MTELRRLQSSPQPRPRPFKEFADIASLDLGSFLASPAGPEQTAMELLDKQATTLLTTYGQTKKVDGVLSSILPTTVQAPFMVNNEPVFATLTRPVTTKEDPEPDASIIFLPAARLGKRVHTFGQRLLPMEFRSIIVGGINLGTRLIAGHRNNEGVGFDADQQAQTTVAQSIISELTKSLQPEIDNNKSKAKEVSKQSLGNKAEIIIISAMASVIGLFATGMIYFDKSLNDDEANARANDQATLRRAQVAYDTELPEVVTNIKRDGFSVTNVVLADEDKIDIIDADRIDPAGITDNRPATATMTIHFGSCAVDASATIRYPDKSSRTVIDVSNYVIGKTTATFQSLSGVTQALGDKPCVVFAKPGS